MWKLKVLELEAEGIGHFVFRGFGLNVGVLRSGVWHRVLRYRVQGRFEDLGSYPYTLPFFRAPTFRSNISYIPILCTPRTGVGYRGLGTRSSGFGIHPNNLLGSDPSHPHY